MKKKDPGWEYLRMRWALLVFLSFVLGSCSLFGLDHKPRLVGSWQWIRSTGGIGGQTVTPETPGYSSKLLRFEEETAALFRADTLVWRVRYSVEEKDDQPMVVYYLEDEEAFLPAEYLRFKGASKDTLVLRENCFDCYTQTYRRVD